MDSRAKFLGHAIHPILVMFPAGLLLISLVFDGLRLLTGKKQWGEVAFWNIVAGIISGYIAAIPGLVDWWHLPKGSRAKSVGTAHAISNNLGLGLFIAGALLRRDAKGDPSTAALACSVAGATGIGLGGYLGGELVERLGVGVTPGANVNAPWTLTHPEWKDEGRQMFDEGT